MIVNTLELLHVLTSGAAATAAALCVMAHLGVGWGGRDARTNRFGRFATACSTGLTAGMVLTVVISWAVHDCERTTTALVLTNAREILFAVSLAMWAYYMSTMGES